MKLLLPLKGSIQNPTFAPDGKAFLVTRFRGGYNLGASDLYVGDVRDRERVSLVTKGDLQGQANVSQPGFKTCWHESGRILFSTDFGGNDWPHTIRPDGSELVPLPGRAPEFAGYEPTFSPSGVEFAFERHKAGEQGGGHIVVSMTDLHGHGGVGHKIVSRDGADARQPSWSPDGSMLVWQEKAGNEWRLAIHHIATGDTRMITPAGYTDATWHPEGDRVVCSGENALYEVTTTGRIKPLYPVEHPRTEYLGAPSWSGEVRENGRRRLMCEATNRSDPDGGPGTWLEIF